MSKNIFCFLFIILALMNCKKNENKSIEKTEDSIILINNENSNKEKYLKNIPLFDTFFCVDGPLRIRSEPNLTSMQLGSLDIFDKADILEKMENITIDNISDFWYKIRTSDDIEGYVFGGYGIVLKTKYEIKTIDDFVNMLPSLFQVEELGRYIFVYDANKGIPMVRINYGITFMDHVFNLWIFYRPASNINVNDITNKYNLEIINANNGFGRGDSYKILTDVNKSSEIITFHGNRGRYFFSHWGSSISYDIANFLFEIEFDDIFDGIIVSPLNLWLNNRDSVNILKIDNDFIEESKINRIKESILYQIFYELMLRVKI